MKPLFFLTFTGLCALGWLAGRWAVEASAGNREAETSLSGQDSARKLSDRGEAVTSTSLVEKPARAVSEGPREAEETLLTLPDAELYGRLARWLTDANSTEIAGFWEKYRTQGKHSDELCELIFLNWTRLDLQGALAATRGMDGEKYCWWAAAAIDPEEAVKEAMGRNDEVPYWIMKGIGEFHPEWLRTGIERIPDHLRRGLLEGIGSGGDGENPRTTLELLLKDTGRIERSTLTHLISQDPLAAYDLLREHPFSDTLSGFASSRTVSPIRELADSLAAANPALLEQLSARTPPGADKREMESAMFRQLLASDPVEAMKQALATTAPRIAAERLATVAAGMADRQPEQAIALINDLFEIYPPALHHQLTVAGPDDQRHTDEPVPGVDEVVENLLASHPQEIMELPALRTHLSGDEESPSLMVLLQARWLERDVWTFAAWVDRQTDPEIRTTGINQIVTNRMSEHDYPNAVQWATKQNRDVPIALPDLFGNWKEVAPEAAMKWLETADLPEAERAGLRAKIEPGGN